MAQGRARDAAAGSLFYGYQVRHRSGGEGNGLFGLLLGFWEERGGKAAGELTAAETHDPKLFLGPGHTHVKEPPLLLVGVQVLGGGIGTGERFGQQTVGHIH